MKIKANKRYLTMCCKADPDGRNALIARAARIASKASGGAFEACDVVELCPGADITEEDVTSFMSMFESVTGKPFK